MQSLTPKAPRQTVMRIAGANFKKFHHHQTATVACRAMNGQKSLQATVCIGRVG
jgi:hypothetical protein